MTSLLIWATVRIAFVYWAARYLAGFSTSQPIFITCAAAVIEVRHLKHLSAGGFRPFRLWIAPNYSAILADAGIIASGAKLGDHLRANNIDGTALLEGVTAFVLSYNADAGTHLVVWRENLYTSSLGSSECVQVYPGRGADYTSTVQYPIAQIDLDGLSLPLARQFAAECRAANGRLKARFGVRPGRFGLDVFMRIDEDWWRNRWAESGAMKPQFIETRHWRNGSLDLIVAVIPYSQFQYFYKWKPTWVSISQRRAKNDLNALGWTECPGGLPGDQSSFITHKYLKVSHEPIERYL